MSNTSRIRNILRSKASKGLDKLEDPRDVLDESYDQLVRMLQQVRQGLAEVATAKKRIELQGQEMGTRHSRLTRQAQEAMGHGREDLARIALERRVFLEGQVASIRTQFTALQRQTAGLQDKERRLAERVAAFRIEKETIKATYTASEAQVRVNETLGGVGSQMSDVGESLDRARDRVAQMRARAAATDELLSSGALGDLTAAPDADLERALASVALDAEVEQQLRSMKSAGSGDAELAGSPQADGPDAWLSIGGEPGAR
ncbi:PspA/IM30 family protein [Mycetocola zhujimingii]|uniref:PspA/IM30 family protein n=1 Tax=Mycetocola zhujimingii TaxID=2079792 RepID=UPI000D33D602|nr:PspA/IM30 family protein [Mycetocola zhujimingii]AWB86552.1 phage shock protein A [Mycetocola zhujimingii]